MGIASFDEIAKSLMDEYLSWEPSLATQVGWHKYDSVLRDPSEAATRDRVNRLTEFVRQLEELEDSSMTEEQALDRDLAVSAFRLKAYELGKLQLYKRMSTACEEVGNSLFFLFLRETPSFRERLDAIISRLEAAPEFLRKSRQTLTDPYRIWNEASCETARELPSFLMMLNSLQKEKGISPGLSGRLSEAVTRAIEAIDEHAHWLCESVLPSASRSYAITPDEYSEYMRLRGYGVTPEELLTLGELHLKKVKREMARLSVKIVPTGRAGDALRRMKADHPPSFASVLQEYRASAATAREFLAANDIVTLPEGEKLLILETPPFLRPTTPFAAEYEPGKFDGNLTSMFLVTPNDGNLDMLKEHSRSAIVNTTVHEGYPGHHLQGVCANTNSSSLRVLVSSPDFAEGWALYSEEMMISSGYNDSPFGKLTILHDLAYRIVRLIVEARLVKGDLTIEEGARMLSTECNMELSACRIEARACAMAPTYFSSYFIGKLGVLQMREDLQKALGGRFSQKFFHDALIYSGCMPMPFMRRALALRTKSAYGLDIGSARETVVKYGLRNA